VTSDRALFSNVATAVAIVEVADILTLSRWRWRKSEERKGKRGWLNFISIAI